MKKLLISLILVFSLVSLSWGGVAFDNVDDYIDSNYTPSYSATDDFSICGWASLDNAASGEEYIAAYISHSVQPDGLVQFGVSNGASCVGNDGLHLLVYIRDDNGNLSTPAEGLCSDTTITVNTPFSVCLTYDDSEADGILYMNGVQVAIDTTVDAIGVKNGAFPREFFIGARNNEGTPNSFWDGNVYEIAFWDNVVLSATEVSLYHNARTRRMPCQIQPTALIKYLPMDDVPDGTSADGDSFRAECGSSLTAGTGVDGADNVGLSSVAEKTLSYP